MPFGVYFNSGSFVKRPTRTQRLIIHLHPFNLLFICSSKSSEVNALNNSCTLCSFAFKKLANS
jgi:hypothetical protein